MVLTASVSRAEHDLPLEALLVRAKNVLIAHVLSTDETPAAFRVSFKVVTDLRNNVSKLRGDVAKDLSLTDQEYTTDAFKKGSQWLLLSQGDNRYGEPSDIMGMPMKGQSVWCGWIALPLTSVGGKTYVRYVFSFCDGQPFDDLHSKADGPSLELSRVKRLLQRFPYNPNINN